MSADNGIYIGQFDDGWRVIYAQAIENIYCSPKKMYGYFRYAPLHKSEEAALLHAGTLYTIIAAKGYPLEYGISNLGYLGKPPKGTPKSHSKNAKTKVRKYRRTTKTHKKK